MRIAQVSPLYESVPPQLYGGTERIVSYLTEKLVEHGHEVTLFASGDSITNAKLIPVCKKSLRLYGEGTDQLSYHFVELQEVINLRKEFDIIHFHIDYLHYPVSTLNQYHHVSTLHGRQDIKGLDLLYRKYNFIPLVSISNHQQLPLPHANWIETVYHGIPVDLLKPNFQTGQYLAFLGRISPEKRVDLAIEIAIKAQLPIKIAAKIDVNDQAYFEQEIKHLFNHPLVEYIGEINDSEKENFLGNAIALLFPIDWPEPFGLVMIESMACATPVIAFNRGSVPEVIDEGITGFLVNSVNEAVEVLKKIQRIDRKKCRKQFEERFASDIMTLNYERVYNTIIEMNNREKNKYVNAV